MTRLLAWILTLTLLTGCGTVSAGPKRYEASFLTLFDTVTTMVGFADSEGEFRQTAQAIHDELLVYHQLFDIYNEYPGMNNLKTVNDRAGEPVRVDGKIIGLLLFCKDMERATGGMVNPAMGSVLSLWHEARTDGINDPSQAKLPDSEALRQAAEHMDFDRVIIDEEAGTVCLSDPEMRLDVGAVAKGYAVEQVCRGAPEGLLISVGGNVRGTGPKPDGSDWVVGLQDPDGTGNLHTVYNQRDSVVTSGDYQRYYLVDGEVYHHIIDPETLMPGTKWRAVSILCADSGVADALSTALFLLSREEGEALLKQFNAEAMWLDRDGNEYFTDGFTSRLRT